MVTTVFTPSAGALNADDTNTNISFRIRCTLSVASNGSLQVTFTARSGVGLRTTHCSMGKWDGVAANADTTAVPIELKFGGASGFNIAAGASITSDLTAHPGFSLSSTDTLVVIFDVSSPGGQRTRASNTNASTYFQTGTTSWSTQNPVGYNPIAGTDYCIAKIETNDAGGGPSSKLKVWNGSAWVLKPAKVWTGSAWVTKPVKTWNGSAWI